MRWPYFTLCFVAVLLFIYFGDSPNSNKRSTDFSTGNIAMDYEYILVDSTATSKAYMRVIKNKNIQDSLFTEDGCHFYKMEKVK